DGNLQFLGRADDQVKIRGFRIELGEIEDVLSRHPAIQAAAVGATAANAGESQELVGYLVPREASFVPGADLRRWLLDRMPDYMVPTHFATLSTLPLTPSGKVDRRALPRYEATRAETKSTAPAPPATPLERIIARLW
ncbi:MAG: AMP-binding enzyme, partial [Nostoc sp.]